MPLTENAELEKDRQPQETATLASLTSSRVLARNTVFNLIGQCAPILVAVFAIKLLIQYLGTDRFGYSASLLS